MTKQYKNYVNGEWKLSKEEIKIYAPATGEELGSVPAMSQEEVDYVYALSLIHIYFSFHCFISSEKIILFELFTIIINSFCI